MEVETMKLLCGFILACTLAPASDSDFDRLVRSMESEYGTKRLTIPFFGVVNFFVKTIRPAGARDVKLAIFEDIDGRLHPTEQRLNEMAQGWKPFVRVQSKRERVHIYSREAGKDWELLLATLERNEAVVMRVRVNPDGLAKWVNNPLVMARRH
jgi:hypothetical protein